MKTFEFDVVIKGVSEFSDEQIDAIYEAGCDDGTLVSRNGVAFIGFDREAGSLEAAISSAVADVAKVGLEVEKVEIDPALLKMA